MLPASVLGLSLIRQGSLEIRIDNTGHKGVHELRERGELTDTFQHFQTDSSELGHAVLTEGSKEEGSRVLCPALALPAPLGSEEVKPASPHRWDTWDSLAGRTVEKMARKMPAA